MEAIGAGRSLLAPRLQTVRPPSHEEPFRTRGNGPFGAAYPNARRIPWTRGHG